jgi:rod shape-determining protein MreC
LKENSQFKILIILLIISAIILFAGLTGKGITFKVIGNALFVKPVNGILYGIRSIGTSASNFVAMTKQKIALENENNKLKENISYLEERIKLLQSIYYENQSLKAALGIKESQTKWNLEISKVIGYSNLSNTIIIDKGSRNGIKKNMAVVYSFDGKTVDLVGITVEIDDRSSKILLSTSPDFKVGVKNIIRGGIEIASGNGVDIEIDSFSRNLDIQIGDLYITSGLSDIYPPNIIVGQVKEIANKNSVERLIQLKPPVEADKLLNVFILTSHE